METRKRIWITHVKSWHHVTEKTPQKSELKTAVIELAEQFCYLRSYISNCDKDCQTRIGKANSVFRRLHPVRKSECIGTARKVMSTMPYSAESWPLSVTARKTLEAARQQFERRILGITCKDNQEQGNQSTKLEKVDLIITERRLRWRSHLSWMTI